MEFDFGGYATRNDVKCSDGRTIRKGAFTDNDGVKVPLVWQHTHKDPSNVLGHAYLEEVDDGMYCYGKFNDTEAGQQAKSLVEHGDISSLSIYANSLVQKAEDVIHGVIREVSLVLAGANPGAFIDFVAVQHADGDIVVAEDEAIIYSGDDLEYADEDFEHADEEMSFEDVLNEFEDFDDDAKEIVYAIVGAAVSASAPEQDMKQSDIETEGNQMKVNTFSKKEDGSELKHAKETLATLFEDAKSNHASIRNTVEAYIKNNKELKHGITNIDQLFPDAKLDGQGSPYFISRDMAWVAEVFAGVRKTAFSRIKSTAFDITADEARAKGYIKGTQKVEEQIAALKRVTTPTTVYKKQKLDRDDILDITDFDVVQSLKGEMRVMLNEELARAFMVGDGREIDDADKINETNIRPIWTDDNVYCLKSLVTTTAYDATTTPGLLMDAAVRGRKGYRGSGNCTAFIGTNQLADMRLLKDGEGRLLYRTDAEIAAYLRVSKIVEADIFDGLSRVDGTTTKNLAMIIVNLNDYTVGADRGGEINMFDDFDIDFNQMKYLIETRCSAGLRIPASAIVVEYATTA